MNLLSVDQEIQSLLFKLHVMSIGEYEGCEHDLAWNAESFGLMACQINPWTEAICQSAQN